MGKGLAYLTFMSPLQHLPHLPLDSDLDSCILAEAVMWSRLMTASSVCSRVIAQHTDPSKLTNFFTLPLFIFPQMEKTLCPHAYFNWGNLYCSILGGYISAEQDYMI